MSDLEEVLRRGMASMGSSWESEVPPFEPGRSTRSTTRRRTDRRGAITSVAVLVGVATAMTYIAAPEWVRGWFTSSEAECGTVISAEATLVANAPTPNDGELQLWNAPTEGGGITTAVAFESPGEEPAIGASMCGANGRRLSESSTLAVDIRDGGRSGLSVVESRVPGAGVLYAFGFVRDEAEVVAVTWTDGQSVEVPITGGYYIAVHTELLADSSEFPRISSVEAVDASGAVVARRE